MKFGAIPENTLEWLALKAGKLPTPVLDVLFGPLKARAVMAGVKLGVLDRLSAGPADAQQLAAFLNLDAEGLEMLLRVLVHCDYLKWDGRAFSLSSLAKRTLAPGARMDRRGYVEWNYTQWDILGKLDDLVRTGNSVDLHETLRDPAEWKNYQLGMLENARDHADYLARKVRVPPGAKSLIDLGGSHGLLGAAICSKHPGLHSTVFDLEPALRTARELAASEGIAGVVRHVSADILTDDLGSNHDVALLANVLHHFGAEQNKGLLKRVGAALQPLGAIAIWEFERPKRNAKVSAGDALALYFRLTSSGSAYHADEYSAWLQSARFEKIQVFRPRLAPGYVLLVGRR